MIGYGNVGQQLERRIVEQGLGEIVHVVKSRHDPLFIPEHADIVVDCTAQKGLHETYLKWMASGKVVVTANKHPILELPLPVFHRAVCSEPRQLLFNATVCTHLPIFTCIDELRKGGDDIECIQAAFSSTLGVIASKMSEGQSFDDALGYAIEYGFTESDYMRDLSGDDVEIKASIMARYVGIARPDLPIVVERVDEASLRRSLSNGKVYGVRLSHSGIEIGWMALPFQYGVQITPKLKLPIVFSAPYGGVENAVQGIVDDILLASR
jgi:homoserine dehydrogenase